MSPGRDCEQLDVFSSLPHVWPRSSLPHARLLEKRREKDAPQRKRKYTHRPQQLWRVCFPRTHFICVFGIRSHLPHRYAVYSNIWCPRNPGSLIRFKKFFIIQTRGLNFAKSKWNSDIQRSEFSFHWRQRVSRSWSEPSAQFLPPLIYSTLFWQTLQSWKLAFFPNSSLGCNHKPIF